MRMMVEKLPHVAERLSLTVVPKAVRFHSVNFRPNW